MSLDRRPYNVFCFLFQFQSFSLEPAYEGECYDYVTIETDNYQSPKSCGQREELENLYFTSNSGPIVVSIITDSKIVHRGFQAIAYTLDEAGNIRCNVFTNKRKYI